MNESNTPIEQRHSLFKRVMFTPLGDLLRLRVVREVPPDEVVPSPRILLARIHFTPWADLLRFRVSSRLDAKAIVAAAELPVEIRRTIWDVVRRTRLWRSEKADLARELINHFEDGLEGGGDPEDLIETFGDVGRTSRLIRRAKRRCRPLWWHGLFWLRCLLGVAVAALVVFYAFLFVRFQLGSPTIKFNYQAELNARARAIPKQERAWPVYREALVALKPLEEALPDWSKESEEASAAEQEPDGAAQSESHPDGIYEFLTRAPGSPYWDDVKRYVDANHEALQLTRRAAMKPHLGFIHNDPANTVSLPVLEGRTLATVRETENPDVVGILLPHVDRLQILVRMLRADTLAAAEVDDAERAYADIVSLLGLANQLNGAEPFLVIDLYRVAVLNMATDAIRRLISSRADLFSDDKIRDLAHELAAIGDGGQIRLDFEGERAMFRDICQRMYTDDGQGNGRLTPEGVHLLAGFPGLLSGRYRLLQESEAAAAVVGPALSLGVAGRREMMEEAERLLAKAELEAATPLWERSDRAFESEIKALASTRLEAIRYMPLVLLFLPVRSVTERQTMERDATLVALALELYRRRQGEWPERLDQLVPDLLPEVPKDRWDGKPLKYRVIDGEPVVYSVGIDRTDDGADVRLAYHQKDWLSPEEARQLPPDDPDRGDIVFRPVVDDP